MGDVLSVGQEVLNTPLESGESISLGDIFETYEDEHVPLLVDAEGRF